MHCKENLLKEVHEKLVQVEKALNACETEKNNLKHNLTVIKQAVDESFKRHIGTFQCRAKWLVCHADSIFHLKDGSLGQQEAELELILNELKNCLEAADCTLNSREEIELMANNVLQNASKVTLQPCESGSMTFSAHDEKMEESIISFGDIDLSTYEQTNDYDVISDEGIVVVENTFSPKQIEMEVKSIEMHHLTAQSANCEKEDFEKVEMESENIAPMTSQISQNDSALGEETESCKSVDWLHPSSCLSKKRDSTGGVRSDAIIQSQTGLNDLSDCSEKVPQWLKSCQPVVNPWVRPAPSNSLVVPTVPKVQLPAPKDQFNDAVGSKGHKRQASLSFMDKESANLHHLNGIFRASNSKFLRIDVENMDKSVYSLHSALDSLALLEKEAKTLIEPEMESVSSPSMSNSSNIDHFIGIFHSPSANFLRCDTQATLDESVSMVTVDESVSTVTQDDEITLLDNNTSNIDHFTGIFNSPGSNFLRVVSPTNDGLGKNNMLDSDILSDKKTDLISESIRTDSHYSSITNLDYFDRISDSPETEYLIESDTSMDGRILTSTFRKSSPNLDHFRTVLKQPDNMFLRRSTETKKLDPELCGWLRGTADKNCGQCIDFDDCSFTGKFDAKWIKTATDW